MATFQKFNSLVEAICEKKHDFSSDFLKVALCNALNAPVATNAVLLDLTTVAITNLDQNTITVTSSSQTSGTYSLVISDLTMTATGGSVGPFRYVVIYNDTATNDELVAFFDYGSEITLAQNESIKLDAGTNLFTLQ